MKIYGLICMVLIHFHGAAFEKKPWVIGHRGASGYRPEHTLESFKLAIEQGADFIEPDLVVTRDKILIARHEPEISETTDAAQKFPDRKRTKKVDGKSVTGWFAEDFTLKEIKTLRAKERLPIRNQSFNGKFEVPTLEEIIQLVSETKKSEKKNVGLIPEIKHPSYFREQGLSLEPLVAEILTKHKLASKDAPIYVQSFELDSIQRLKKLISVKTVFLLYPDESRVPNLKGIAKVATAIGPHKSMIIPIKEGKLGEPTSLVKEAKKLGLEIFPYTFRSEKEFLSADYNGDPGAEYRQFYKLGIDGVFTDFPDTAVAARK